MNAASESVLHLSFLVSGGEMVQCIREFDWRQSALGPPKQWPQSLRSALSICLDCGFPIAIYWGRDLALLYNDAWSPIPAAKHPWALGHPAREVWPEIWEEIAPLFAQVQKTGEAVRRSDQLLPMHRRGFIEECYFDFTFSPIRDEAGGVGGIFNAAIETTPRVLAERRAQLLRDLAASTVDAATLDAAVWRAASVFEGDRNDLPFTLLYLTQPDGTVRLAAASGFSAAALAQMPETLDPRDPKAPFPFLSAAQLVEGEGFLMEKGALAVFGDALSGGPWPEPVERVLIHALPRAGGDEKAGFFVAALSPRLAWDDEYCGSIAQAARGVATVTDVAAKRLAADHVKWLADFPEHNPNPVIEVDLKNGSIFYANSYSLQRIPDLKKLGLRHPFLVGVERAAQPLIEGRLQVVRREVCVEGNWFMQSLCYLPDCRHVRLYCTDISALKHAETRLRENEETLRVARDEAEKASRAKDNFLAMLSHELRTPLTPVLMTVAALEHDATLSAAVREDLAMMKRNIELETKLIDDLLDLNRVSSGKLKLEIEAVDLNEAVRHVCVICRQQLHERGIHLEAELDAGLGQVNADPARLQQVLWNVLKNAIKFTPDQGTIRVTTRQIDVSRAEVRVQDSGVGIPAEMLPRIFNAFEQGDSSIPRRFGGLGLGLAICKALMELHHGTIRAESGGAGQGSTFIIELPGKVLTATAKIRLAAPAEHTETPQLRLLVVEDHPDTLRTLARLLKRAGFTVLTASSVAGATALATQESFDMLVSDLGLPDGDGREIMRRVRALHHVPGIAMSGYGTDEDMQRSREAGFSEHLIKPVEFAALHQAILRLAADIAGG